MLTPSSIIIYTKLNQMCDIELYILHATLAYLPVLVIYY